MTQFAFEMTLHSGADDEYIRLHDPIPDEVTAQLEAAGITDYSIFVNDGRVFGVYRCVDLDRARAALAYDASPEWTRAVVALIADRKTDPDFPMLRIPRVFRFEGGASSA
ncbi:hypothetical protein BH10ACT7_BH10ACT7_23550 [soil metagenome]